MKAVCTLGSSSSVSSTSIDVKRWSTGASSASFSLRSFQRIKRHGQFCRLETLRGGPIAKIDMR